MSRKGAYYNEHDPFAAAWLRELIRKNLIAPGDVDERDIQEVKGSDLDGYTQVHFFAGIGGWSYALRLAGWPDDRPVWTGSCPCQPFSAAGKRQGEADARHLWPEMRRLIAERTPAIAFGEQVASDDGCQWLAGVFADLEKLEYRVAGADLCAAGESSPHIRQRIYWVADAGIPTSKWNARSVLAAQARERGSRKQHGHLLVGPQHGGTTIDARGMDNSTVARRNGAITRPEIEARDETRMRMPGTTGRARWMGESIQPRLEGHAGHGDSGIEPGRLGARADGPSAATGAWSNFAIVYCRDGKARRVEPSTFPLADGVPNRVGTLCGAGNAIVPQVAARFIEASMMALEEA